MIKKTSLLLAYSTICHDHCLASDITASGQITFDMDTTCDQEMLTDPSFIRRSQAINNSRIFVWVLLIEASNS